MQKMAVQGQPEQKFNETIPLQINNNRKAGCSRPHLGATCVVQASPDRIPYLKNNERKKS
jgi:hypothetical protein